MSGVSGSRSSAQVSAATAAAAGATAAAAGAAAGAGVGAAVAAAAAGVQTRDMTQTQSRGSAQAAADLFSDAANAVSETASQVGEAVANVIQELRNASPPPPPNVINERFLEVLENFKQQSRQMGEDEGNFMRAAADALESAARDIGRVLNPPNNNAPNNENRGISDSVRDGLRRAIENVNRTLQQQQPEPPPVGDFPLPDPSRRHA